MEKDFTYTLGILKTLKEANLDRSAIESLITSLKIEQSKKRFMSILNTGFNFRTDYYVKTDLFDLYTTSPYEFKLGSIGYN